MRQLFSNKGYDWTLLKTHNIEKGNVYAFSDIFKESEGYQLDTETNMCDTLFKRELLLVQIGSLDGKHQFVFDVLGLTDLEMQLLKKYLGAKQYKKFIHNALFEYTVIQKGLDIDIDNIRDTFIMSRLTCNGLNKPKGYHGLAGLIYRCKGIELDKGAQTTFFNGVLAPDQLNYAFDDVLYIKECHDQLQQVVDHYDLENTVRLKCAAVRSYGDMMSSKGGLTLDTDRWIKTAKQLETDKKEIEDKMNDIIKSKEFYDFCTSNDMLQKVDSYEFRWGSPKARKAILEIEFPECPSFRKPDIKKYIKEGEHENAYILQYYSEGEFEKVEEFFVRKHSDKLKALGCFTPAGKILINWGSTSQRLELFQQIEPKLKGTGKDDIDKIDHPLIRVYKKFTKISKAVTSYGEKFLENLDADGKMRPHHINFILNTGRTAVGALMTIPAKKEYRNCFYPDKGWKMVGIDYSSLESVILAFMSGDPVWDKVLREGGDLHSTCARLVFNEEWTDAEGWTEPGDPVNKPKTAEGNRMRQFVKAISFGLAYGMGPRKLADNLDITLAEAKELIKSYFIAFPKIGECLEDLAETGFKQLYSETLAPFYLKRFFDEPRDHREEAAIKRASKNSPIQGAGATITEYALVLVKKEIEAKNLPVKFFLAIHDEIQCIVREDFAEEWAVRMRELMIKAGKMVITSGLLGAEGGVSDVWEK